MPETEQLDPRLGAAFDHITRDISGRSAPPGARAAIRTARRRRAGYAGSVAVLALVAGGVAAGALLPGEGSAGVAEQGDDAAVLRTLPDPAPFTADGFTVATDGWTGPWQDWEGGVLRPADESCLETALDEVVLDWGDGVAEPKRAGNYEMTTDSGGAAAVEFYSFRSAADAGILQTMVRDALDSCEPHTAATANYANEGTEGPEGGVAAVVEFQDKVAATVAVQISDRVALGYLVTPGEEGVPDEAVLGRIADTLAAGAQDDATYQHDLTTSDEPAEPPDGEDYRPSAHEFAALVDGWVTTWRPGGTPEASQQAPCMRDGAWLGGPDRMSGGSFGTTGDYTNSEWTSVTDAQEAWGILNESLEQCESARWEVTPRASSSPGIGSLWATYDGGTVFAARHDGNIIVVHLDGESNPPVEVADKVLDFLAADLATHL